MNKEKKENEEKIDAEDDMTEFEVHEVLVLEDGKHIGTIERIKHKKTGENRQYDYLDIYITLLDDNNNEVTIKTGFPCYISINSQLGKFLEASGMEFVPKDKIRISDIRASVVGKEIHFQTFTEDNFARIINKTIKF